MCVFNKVKKKFVQLLSSILDIYSSTYVFFMMPLLFSLIINSIMLSFIVLFLHGLILLYLATTNEYCYEMYMALIFFLNIFMGCTIILFFTSWSFSIIESLLIVAIMVIWITTFSYNFIQTRLYITR